MRFLSHQRKHLQFRKWETSIRRNQSDPLRAGINGSYLAVENLTPQDLAELEELLENYSRRKKRATWNKSLMRTGYSLSDLSSFKYAHPV